MKRVVFFFVLALGFTWNCHAAQTWTFVQEGLASNCIPGASSCHLDNTYGTMAPPTAGTVRILFVRLGNSSGSAPTSKISSVSGLGSTWNLCSNCNIGSGNDALDMAYAIGGSGGSPFSLTVNLTGASGNAFFTVYLYEFMPPAGSTASFDASGINNSTCSGTATGVSLSVAATDLIFTGRGRGDPANFNSYGSGWIQTPGNNAFSLNNSTGTAPTVACSGSVLIFNAIAFKSTAGVFTPPAPSMTAVNYTNNNNVQLNCNTSCSLSIPSTGSGNLLYLQAADINTSFISSVSGAGTGWVVPAGSNSCRISMSGGYALSCAYLLSTTSGATSLNITMTGGGAVAFAVMEVHPLSGQFSFDVQGSTQNAPSLNPSGQPLTLGGNADVIFQTIFVPGGTTADTYYPMPPSAPKTQSMFFNNQAALVALLNASSAPTPTWADQQNNNTIATGVAFKAASGTATAPNPPTGLTAVVN